MRLFDLFIFNQYHILYIIAVVKRKWVPTIKVVLKNRIRGYLKLKHVYNLIFKKVYGASFGEGSYHSVKIVWWSLNKYNTNFRIRRKRENRIVRWSLEKERNIQGWPNLDHRNSKHRKKPISHILTTWIIGTVIFFHF